MTVIMLLDKKACKYVDFVLYCRSKHIKQTMIEGVVLTLVLMTFCIGSAIGIVNYGTKGRFF